MAKTGESKQKKMNARVDFTPMVDMIMLLVTFFMLCTSLIKPKTMEISMPSNKEDLKEEQKSQVAASKAITILLDENNELYYFSGLPEILMIYVSLINPSPRLSTCEGVPSSWKLRAISKSCAPVVISVLVKYLSVIVI